MTAAALKGMAEAQIDLEKAAECLDAEPPPCASALLSTIPGPSVFFSSAAIIWIT